MYIFILKEATKTIAYLRGLDNDDPVVQKIVQNMKEEDDYFKSLPNLTIVTICKCFTMWRKKTKAVLFLLLKIIIKIINSKICFKICNKIK